MAIQQFTFEPYASTTLGTGVDLVAVGRFDRMNLFAGSANRSFHLYDNVTRTTVEEGAFEFTPLIEATQNGARALALGLTKNVCH